MRRGVPVALVVVGLWAVVACGAGGDGAGAPTSAGARPSGAGGGNPTITAPPASRSTPEGTDPTRPTDPGSTTTAVAPPPPTTTPTPVPDGPIDGVPPVPGVPATAMLDRLRVAAIPLDLPDYRRKAFGDGWDYDNTSGCNVRERVLIEESLDPPTMGERCRPLAGRWVSRYDGVATADPADLEIDHLVALAEAWRTGAADWTEARREAFANDLDDPGTLVAVTTRSNRSKGDSPPDVWLPPTLGARCDYVEDWIRVKARWDLAVSPAEKATLVQVLAGC